MKRKGWIDGKARMERGLFLWQIEEEFAWMEGMTLKGLNFVQKDKYVLLVVKAESKGGRYVAFLEGADIDDAFYNLWLSIHRKGWMQWRKDKYAKLDKKEK